MYADPYVEILFSDPYHKTEINISDPDYLSDPDLDTERDVWYGSEITPIVGFLDPKFRYFGNQGLFSVIKLDLRTLLFRNPRSGEEGRGDLIEDGSLLIVPKTGVPHVTFTVPPSPPFDVVRIDQFREKGQGGRYACPEGVTGYRIVSRYTQIGEECRQNVVQLSLCQVSP